MKQCENFYQFEVVEKRHKEHASYTLLRLEGRDLVKYAVAVEDSAGHDLVLLNQSKEACVDFFNRVAEGELSSIHLCEVVEDFFHDHCLEIF